MFLKTDAEKFERLLINCLIAILIGFILFQIAFSRVSIKGNSMYPTLHEGDQILINKLNTWTNNYDYGDIIVFHVDEETSYIKRVIGLPNDVIRIKDNKVFVNGEPIKEDYLDINYKKSYEQATHKEFNEAFSTNLLNEVKVPEGYLFVMGDNRPKSKDSRDISIGYISQDSIAGKLLYVYQ